MEKTTLYDMQFFIASKGVRLAKSPCHLTQRTKILSFLNFYNIHPYAKCVP